MQANATKLLARGRSALQTASSSPVGQGAWAAYVKAGELFGVNVNEPIFGKDAELKTQQDLAQAHAKGYIVTDAAGQSKLWNQVYYTAAWEANNSWLLAKKDYETIRAAVEKTPVMDYNLKAVMMHALFAGELYSWYFLAKWLSAAGAL